LGTLFKQPKAPSFHIGSEFIPFPHTVSKCKHHISAYYFLYSVIILQVVSASWRCENRNRNDMREWFSYSYFL